MDNSEYKKLLDDSKVYFNKRYDLLRLELLDKLSRIIGQLVLALVVVLLVFAALAFLGMGAMFLLSKVVPLPVSCAILGAVFLLLIVLAIANKEKLFINPMVRALAGILFSEDPNEAVKTAEEDAHE